MFFCINLVRGGLMRTDDSSLIEKINNLIANAIFFVKL